jgi:hypothetical protein
VSQVVGSQYKSRIPSLGDDASIEEALRVYHYGVDNYTTQSIPDDSVEGNFRKLDIRLTSVEDQMVESVSLSTAPNIIVGQTVTTVPITIRSIVSQSVPLQQWQNSASVNVATIATNGDFATSGYMSVGSTSITSTTAVKVIIASPTHAGMTMRAAGSQSAKMQEWQNSVGKTVSWVDERAIIYSNGDEVGGGIGSFFLIGA